MRFFRREKQLQTGEELKASLYRWYQGRSGRRLLKFEKFHLNEVLANLFGYHLLQIGAPSGEPLFSASRINHPVVLAEDLLEQRIAAPGIAGEAEHLPVMSDSIDVVLLPHVLEFADNPHQVLREVDRVLIPEGHVVLMGFNPWGLWRLWQIIPRRIWSARPPSCCHAISQKRLMDWLSLLGFDVEVTRSYFFRPPFHHAGVMRRLKFLEYLGQRWWPILGSGYMLVAKKRETTLTPIKPHWRSRRRMMGRPLVDPTPRSIKRGREG